jgi:hypothetical protein
MDKKRVLNIVKLFLKSEHTHYGLKVKKIDERIINTYDGEYPLIEITYEKTNVDVEPNICSKISNNIGLYTGLKYKRDFWIGVTVEK